ncbi:hypothetical protein [Pseudomonas marincola]|uniref:hypothetical protein n=1 Tax=Pseudomonas marincola TaxID=437900 RepID=UPI0008E6B1B5|nr:hypothetical protein [Pseudomonas marincola]SFU13198.1 hypothetical protein SAMN05216264_113120 [Pseudomonas marincola]
MADSKYDRLPQAGDFEKNNGVEVVYFSPKPIPVGVQAFSARQLQRDANDTYMDFMVSQGSLEFAARGYIGSVVCISSIFTLIFIFMGFAGYTLGRPFWSSFLQHFLNPYLWGIVGVLAALGTYFMCKAARSIAAYPPTRFNRQRREVAFVLKKGEAPRFVPWEDVIGCASASQSITQYGVTNNFALMLGLRDADSGDVLWVTAPYASLSLVVSEWEAIRVYMEEGISGLPAPTILDEDRFQEGTVEHFYMCRKTYREDHSWLVYFFGFVLLQFFTGWTIPCRISIWMNNRPKAAYPKSVIEWSKLLPPEQHAKPSAELLEQSAQARKAYAEGKTFLQYFGIDEVNEDFV